MPFWFFATGSACKSFICVPQALHCIGDKRERESQRQTWRAINWEQAFSRSLALGLEQQHQGYKVSVCISVVSFSIGNPKSWSTRLVDLHPIFTLRKKKEKRKKSCILFLILLETLVCLCCKPRPSSYYVPVIVYVFSLLFKQKFNRFKMELNTDNIVGI